jgi:hypothetical protein
MSLFDDLDVVGRQRRVDLTTNHERGDVVGSKPIDL